MSYIPALNDALDRACEIYEAAIADRNDEEIPRAWRSDPYTGHAKASRDSLIVTNILRDCKP